MSKKLEYGTSAQKLVATIRNRLRGKGARAALTTFSVGDWVNSGLDCGSEFGFMVDGRDGRSFLVSVNEVGSPKVADKLEQRAERIERQKTTNRRSGQFSTSYVPSEKEKLRATIAERRARKDTPSEERTEEKRLAALERSRLRFLGLTVVKEPRMIEGESIGEDNHD